jgi:hypothetical protein
MELLERYLNEVRRYLPEEQQSDIIAEISDAIQSQFEEREGTLGRPLTGDEQAAIIRAYGHPKVVAARYGTPRYLIGPDVFPFYWYTLKLVLIVVLAAELAFALIGGLLTGNPLHVFEDGVGVMWQSIFIVIGIITVIFSAMEWTDQGKSVLAKLGLDKWNPRRLPPTGRTIPRYKTLIEAIANAAALVVVLDIPNLRHNLGAMFAPLQAMPVWHVLFVPFIVAIAMIVVMDFFLLAYPHWTRFRSGVIFVSNAIIAAALCAILPSRIYVTASGGGHQVAAAMPVLNQVIFVSLIVTAGAFAVSALWNLREFLRRPDNVQFNVSYNGIR